METIFNYYPLSERIATAGQPSEEAFVAVANAGYEVVINLGLLGERYTLPDEEGLVRSLGMEYIHIPVVWTRPTKADLARFCEAMDAHRTQRVFVHCAANKRVSVFVALYRITRLGWSRDEALRDVHRIWLPDETWQSFIDDVLGDGGHSGK